MKNKNDARQEEIYSALANQPLALAIEDVLRAESDGPLARQISELKQTMSTAGPEMRQPLADALASLQAAQTAAREPAARELWRAITHIASEHALPTGRTGRAKPTSPKRRYLKRAEARTRILAALAEQTSLSGPSLAQECDIPYQTVVNCLKQLADEGTVVREGTGRGSSWQRKT